MFRRHQPVGASPENFWGALKGVWFAPRRFFERLDPGGGFFRPAIFASIVLYLNLLLEAALQAVWLREFNFALIYAPFLGLVVALVLAPLLVAGLAVLVLVVLDGAPSRWLRPRLPGSGLCQRNRPCSGSPTHPSSPYPTALSSPPSPSKRPCTPAGEGPPQAS